LPVIGVPDPLNISARHGFAARDRANARRHSGSNWSPSGSPGATNAGILAAQILGLADAAIAKKTGRRTKRNSRLGVEEKSKKLNSTMEE